MILEDIFFGKIRGFFFINILTKVLQFYVHKSKPFEILDELTVFAPNITVICSLYNHID